MRFVTMLVGVRADGTYTPFHTLTWSSTWSGTDGGISTRNPVVPGDLTGSTGGITEVQTNVTLEELPSNVLRLLVNRGASDVPFLDIARQGTTVVVSWPTNILSFVLQRSTNPASAAWSDLRTSANTLSVDAQTPAQYFRLIKR